MIHTFSGKTPDFLGLKKNPRTKNLHKRKAVSVAVFEPKDRGGGSAYARSGATLFSQHDGRQIYIVSCKAL